MTEKSDGETKVVSRKGDGRDSSIPVTIRAKLFVTNGENSGTAFYLEKNRTTVGRSGKSDIQINDEQASRVHLEISFSHMEFRIRDLNSSNGTYLNGSSVVEYALRNNDKIMIGETMLHFTIERI
jgi:pSer/pThr/pTyr-binding forkhead associated (FHA) protein